MLTNLLLFFILGPALALGCFRIFALLSLPATGWRDDKRRMWGIIAAEVFVLLVASSLIGSTLALSAITSLLGFAGFAAFQQDPAFRVLVLDSVSWAVSPAVAWIKRTFFGGAKRAPAPTPGPVPSPTPWPSPQGGGVDVSDINALLRKPRVNAAPVVAPLRDSDEQVLRKLLTEVRKLQEWTARPDAERAALSQLVSDTASTEKALNTAVAQLKTGTVNWNDIHTHVEGLKRHDLPADVATGLNKLVTDRAAVVAADKRHVGELATDLTGKREALTAAVSTPVASPETVISTADATLAAAAELTGSDTTAEK